MAVSGAPAAAAAASEPRMSLSWRRASPRMGMMTMRKEKRATSSRLSPRMMPVAMVVPERERPGRMATAWAQPMMKASR